MRRHIRFAYDPIAILLGTARDLFPKAAAEIFYGGMPVYAPKDATGVTYFHHDGSTPTIVIDPELPYCEVIAILLHEVAHVATEDPSHGEVRGGGHTAEWKKNFETLNRAFIEKMIPFSKKNPYLKDFKCHRGKCPRRSSSR